jgi:hypothetical protein
MCVCKDNHLILIPGVTGAAFGALGFLDGAISGKHKSSTFISPVSNSVPLTPTTMPVTNRSIMSPIVVHMSVEMDHVVLGNQNVDCYVSIQ